MRTPPSERNIRILSLDVSSTACGWAVMEGWPARLVECGRVKVGHDTVIQRANVIAAAVIEYIARFTPDEIVMEWSSGNVGWGKARVRGLAALGQAQGIVYERIARREIHPVVVDERTWTKGKPKEKRAEIIRATWPAYTALWRFDDRGLDVADAIGIGSWWLAKELTDRHVGLTVKLPAPHAAGKGEP